MFKYIPKNKRLLIVIYLGIAFLLIGIPFIINLLFKFNFNINYLETEWSAGDALSYYGSILSFVGTVVLGSLALYQTHIIKTEADKKATNIEELERIENMPNFHMRFQGASGGFCNNLNFSVTNISNNIAYDIEVYDIKLKDGSHTIWEDSDTYNAPVINPQNHILIQTSSKSSTPKDELILFANMHCKDKYHKNHEYLLKMICRYPYNYKETNIIEI